MIVFFGPGGFEISGEVETASPSSVGRALRVLDPAPIAPERTAPVKEAASVIIASGASWVSPGGNARLQYHHRDLGVGAGPNS
jgi:hypothetical protein